MTFSPQTEKPAPSPSDVDTGAPSWSILKAQACALRSCLAGWLVKPAAGTGLARVCCPSHSSGHRVPASSLSLAFQPCRNLEPNPCSSLLRPPGLPLDLRAGGGQDSTPTPHPISSTQECVCAQDKETQVHTHRKVGPAQDRQTRAFLGNPKRGE